MAASNSPAEQLITENIDIWTSAIKKRGSQGRGSSKKIELYGIKKLRELILELAVRGLLVPQDPNDEPASVLLEKIAAEKEQLIKDGKIKKQKALPEISEDEKPFALPNGWSWCHLIDLCNLENGDRSKNYPNKSLLVEEGIPFVNAGHLVSGKIDESQMTFITDERFEILKAGKFSIGDILFCLRGSLGKSAVVDSINKGAIASSLVIVRLRALINKMYIHNYFDSPLSYRQITLYNNGTAQPNLSAADLAKFLVPLPPEAEQPRIVTKVDELMALCDQLEQQTESSLSAHQTLVETLLNTLLNADQNSFDQAWERIAQHFDILFTTEHSIDQLKQTILQLAVMGKLVPQDPNDEPASLLLEKIAAEKEQLIKDKVIKKQKPLPPIGDDEKPFELPVGWKWVRLGSIISLISGQHLKPSEYFETKSENAVPYITGPAEFGVLNPTYSKFTNEKRALAEDGDILITCKGSGLGKWNIAHETIAISRQLMAIRPINLDEEYLRLIIDSKYELFQSKGVGIAIPGISREDITEVLIGLPSEAELHRITEKVSKLMLICIGLKDRIRKSQTTQIHLADVMAEQALL